MSGRHADVGSLKVSDAVRKLNPGLFGVEKASMLVSEIEREAAGGEPAKVVRTFTVPDVAPKGRRLLKQDTKGPNKLEQEFHAFLREEWKPDECLIYAQGLTLMLANGVRYTPDFVVVDAADKVLAFETKGFMRDDAGVKVKVAARVFPWIKFHLVTKRRKKDGGGWAIEEVYP